MTFRPMLRALLGGAALVLALSACGGTPEMPRTDLKTGEAQSVTTPAGLSCVVFNPTGTGGGLACNFAAFDAPAAWSEQTGTLETVDADNGTVAVIRVTDGPPCATLDGASGTGAIVCDYR